MKDSEIFLNQCNRREEKEKKFSSLLLEISLSSIAKNIDSLKKFISKKTGKSPLYLLPVKANAYGHGIIEVSKFLEIRKSVDFLGVAFLQEAFELRESGVSLPILSMAAEKFTEEKILYAAEKNIHLTISSFSAAELAEKTCNKNNKNLSVHLKIETGMGRGGLFVEEFYKTFIYLSSSSHIKISGVMTHFAVADSPKNEDMEYTKMQIEKFIACKKWVEKNTQNSDIIFHTSNSGALCFHPESVFDMVRPGIASYGYPEDFEIEGVEIAMKLSGDITLVKQYPKDFALGYGNTYKTKEDENIGLFPLGYGDGFFRMMGNTPEKNIVGRVSMDQVSISEEFSEIERFSLLDEQFSAKEMAKKAGTISYEILCHLGNSKRVRRKYI